MLHYTVIDPSSSAKLSPSFPAHVWQVFSLDEDEDYIDGYQSASTLKLIVTLKEVDYDEGIFINIYLCISFFFIMPGIYGGLKYMEFL